MIRKINEAITEQILVVDATGTGVTGLVDGDFSKELLKDKGASGDSITITEKGNGYYYIDFTPTGSGIYSWKVTHATYEPNGWYDFYRIVGSNTDDIATTQTAHEAIINRIVGLVQENSYIDNTSYDANGNLTSARIRTYTGSDDVGTGSNVLATYQMTSTYSGSLMSSYKLTLEP